ncbi:MAG: hypothetical protein ACC645_21675, partial [Pirellulales bacterium]
GKQTKRNPRCRRLIGRAKLMAVTGTILGSALVSNLPGQCSGTCSAAPEGTQMAPARPSLHGGPTATETSGPHGGRVTSGQWHSFEVVYTPKETRVFVYSPPGRQLNVRNVHGDAIMEVRGNQQLFRYPVRVSTDVAGQSYLSFPVNVSGVRDGDMRVTFELTGLPLAEEPSARFTQIFALTHADPTFQVSRFTEADSYSQKALASGGEPNRLPGTQGVANHSAAADHGHHQPPRITVTKATEADQAAIRAQGSCPVMKEPLGEHGAPIKITIDGQPLFVCCKGCVRKVEKNPAKYLAMVVQRQARSNGYER